MSHDFSPKTIEWVSGCFWICILNCVLFSIRKSLILSRNEWEIGFEMHHYHVQLNKNEKETRRVLFRVCGFFINEFAKFDYILKRIMHCIHTHTHTHELQTNVKTCKNDVKTRTKHHQTTRINENVDRSREKWGRKKAASLCKTFIS